MVNLQKKKRAILSIMFAVLLILTLAYSLVDSAIAESYSNDYDKINVMDDLNSSPQFDINHYPRLPVGKPRIMHFAEYCYSYRSNLQSNYALYVYVYNPANLDIYLTSARNQIQLAVDGNKAATDYNKYQLLYCNTAGGDYGNRFIKYRVVDKDNKILKSLKPEERRYDISGIELIKNNGNTTADEEEYGATYTYRGYSKGYGSDVNAESTLKCDVEILDTIRLELKNLFYRTESSSKGKDYRNQLDSVYFSVNNDILEKHGRLQKVKAEWYEYKTAPIVVIQDKNIYDTILPYVGKDIGEYTDALRYKLGYDRRAIQAPGSLTVNYGWSYNIHCYTNVGITTTIIDSADKCHMLPYLFDTAGVNAKDYVLSSDRLSKWIYSYDKSYNNGYIPIKDKQVSADLFSNTVDNGRTRGYNCVEIDATQKMDLLSYTSNHGFWDKVADYGFWSTIFGKVPTDDNVFGLEPIYEVKEDDLIHDNAGISNTLLIREDDVSQFKADYNEAKSQNKTTYLFRFAITDYFSGLLDIDDKKSDNGLLIKDKAYMSKETVFLNFDIIQLTFAKDDVYKVMPVVASPIDIINALDPPIDHNTKPDWLKQLLTILAIVLGIIILIFCIVMIIIFFPIIAPIFKLIGTIIAAPFKAIGRIFGGKDKKTSSTIIIKAETAGKKTKQIKADKQSIELAKQRFKKE